MNLDDIINASSQSVISEQHDTSKINGEAALIDKNELLKSGMSMEQIMQNVQLAALRRANLNVAKGKVSTFAVGKPGWHELGVVVSQAATSAEALQFANLGNFNLTKIPQYVDIGDKKIETGMFGIVRTDINEVLGSVKGRYTIVSNEECFDFMDEVIKGGAKYETAGALGKGEKVWMLARMPEVLNVKGDEVENYILFMTSHDGTTSVSVFPTNVRVVCQNTLRMASDKKRKGISIRHSKSVKSKIQAAQKALGLYKNEIEKFDSTAQLLASKQIEPQEYFNAVLDDILDVTVAEQRVTQGNLKNVLDGILEITDTNKRATAEKQLERVLVRRKELFDDIMQRYESERNNSNTAIAGTGWAAFNAVTEHSDYSQLWRNNGNDRQRSENRFESSIYGKGDERKASALELVLERIK